MKKEAAADGPGEPPAGVPGAGVTSAVVQAPLRPHVFDTPSEPKLGAPSRTESATATAATAASAWQEGGRPLRNTHVLRARAACPRAPRSRDLPASRGRAADTDTHAPQGQTRQPLPHRVPETPWAQRSGQMDGEAHALSPRPATCKRPGVQAGKSPQ